MSELAGPPAQLRARRDAAGVAFGYPEAYLDVRARGKPPLP